MTKKELARLAMRLWSHNFDYTWYRTSGRKMLADRSEDRADMVREYAIEIGVDLWTEFDRLPDGVVYPVAVVCRSRYGVWVQIVRGYHTNIPGSRYGVPSDHVEAWERVYAAVAERLVNQYPNCTNIP